MNFVTYLKGILMGICDLIPGISGGTIAFITGIYGRLINAVKNFSPQLVGDFFKYLLKRDKKSVKILREDIKKLDLIFLVTLGAGIATAILLGSRLMKFLLDNYSAFTLSFFIGLILISTKIIFTKIEKHDLLNISFGVIGLFLGILISILIPAKVQPTILYIFLGGFLAISAMFLPGISGAFILLILGIYDFMLEVLHNILKKLTYFIVFVFGAGLGAFVISRVIAYLLKKDRCKTLYVLLGLVVGCLSVPLRRIYQETSTWTISNSSMMLFFLLLGIGVVVLVTRLEKKD